MMEVVYNKYLPANLFCAMLKQVLHHSTVLIPGCLVHWSELWCNRGWCIRLKWKMTHLNGIQLTWHRQESAQWSTHHFPCGVFRHN